MTTPDDDAVPPIGVPESPGIAAPAGALRPRRHAEPAAPAPAPAPKPVASVGPVAAPGGAAEQRRYYLCCTEPSGEYIEVIVAVTDHGRRRRYFTTRDGSLLTEVDEGYFARRSTSGGRSMLELDDREMAELESELQFVRPVRGRDPLADAEGTDLIPDDTDGSDPVDKADDVGEADEIDEWEPPWAVAEERVPPVPSAAPEPSAAPVPPDRTDLHDDQDWTIEEFEAVMTGTMTGVFESGAAEPSVAEAMGTMPPNQASAAAAAQVALAKGIAFVAHRGQLDRVGAAYIDHPGRVAERFDAANDPEAVAAAWLHDVLERSEVTAQDLLEAGVFPSVVEVVQLLTRASGESDDEHFARIRRHPSARRVKLADLDDDSAPWRMRRLDYDARVALWQQDHRARVLLGVSA